MYHLSLAHCSLFLVPFPSLALLVLSSASGGTQPAWTVLGCVRGLRGCPGVRPPGDRTKLHPPLLPRLITWLSSVASFAAVCVWPPRQASPPPTSCARSPGLSQVTAYSLMSGHQERPGHHQPSLHEKSKASSAHIPTSPQNPEVAPDSRNTRGWCRHGAPPGSQRQPAHHTDAR